MNILFIHQNFPGQFKFLETNGETNGVRSCILVCPLS
jgi:hypothetical protein